MKRNTVWQVCITKPSTLLQLAGRPNKGVNALTIDLYHCASAAIRQTPQIEYRDVELGS